MLAALLLGLALALAGAGRGPHPDSLSRSRLVVEGKMARLELRFQSLSLLEVRPELDLDQDGLLSPEECQAARPWIGSYVREHWRIWPGSPPGAGEAEREPLEAELIRVGPARRAREGARDGSVASRGGLGWIEAELSFEAEQELGSMGIASNLFVEASPGHRDMISVVFNAEEELFLPFQPGAIRYEFQPEGGRRSGVFVNYLWLGYAHIKGGFDHLAFLLVLLVAVPRMRSLLGLVSAFTLAHSITLAATVFDPGGYLGSLDGALVEMGIALSISYVACDNLVRRKAHNPWIEAFLFGLLHGLGFAGFLREALGGEPMVVTALVGFNLGVGFGHLRGVLSTFALCLSLFPL